MITPNQERPGLAADFWFDLALTALNVGKLTCNFSITRKPLFCHHRSYPEFSPATMNDCFPNEAVCLERVWVVESICGLKWDSYVQSTAEKWSAIFYPANVYA